MKKKTRLLALLLLFIFGFNIVFAEETQNLSVTATVAAQATDFQATLSAITSGSTFAPNTEIQYQINYGSYLSYSSDITVEAQWYTGTLESNSSTTVDIVDYVSGSATTGYSSTSPTIDTVNKKITWTISGFPASTTDQTVTFKLKTNSAYTGSSKVNFNVAARVLGPAVQTSDSTLTRSYSYSSSSSSSSPTATPTPTTAATSSTTTSALIFNNIEVQTLSKTKATLSVTTNKSATLRVDYGESHSNLNQTQSSSFSSTGHRIELDGLEGNTQYYFQITATSGSQTSTSDFYTFRTALASFSSDIQLKSLVAASGEVVLYQPGVENLGNVIVVPTNKAYSFTFAVDKPEEINKIKAIMRNKSVLGIVFGQERETNSNAVSVIEITPGVFTASLKAPPVAGIYELYLRIFDKSGNIEEVKLLDVKVSPRLTVYNYKKQPLEGAEVLLYYFNKQSSKYEILPTQIFPIGNPLFTNSQGEIDPALPNGKYMVKITALGYAQKEVKFKIGPKANENYPKIYMAKTGFNPLITLYYYGTILQDFIQRAQTYVFGLSQSNRFFNLLAIFTATAFIFLSYLSLRYRIRIPLKSVQNYLDHYFSTKWLPLEHIATVRGRVLDYQGKPVPSADTYLLDDHGSIVSHNQTDGNGYFRLNTGPKEEYKVMIIKQGNSPQTFVIDKLKKNDKNQPLFVLGQSNGLRQTKNYIEEILDFSFEGILLITLLLEIALGFSLGWLRTSPFILLSAINLAAWLAHLNRLWFEKRLR